jgi:hypothetical protein
MSKKRLLRAKKKNLSPDKKASFADFIKYHWSIIITLVFGAIGFLTIPNLLLLPYNSLECSWAIGLNLAIRHGLQFGKDIVFPFGPLGFMYYPYFCEFNTWLISSAFCLFAHCLFIFSIILMIKKLSIPPIDCVLIGIALMFALPQMSIDYKILFSILMLSYLSLVSPSNLKRLLTLYAFLAFMMAAISLIKFTAAMISISILLFMSVFYLYKKQVHYLYCILSVYIISILALLVITGQKIVNFPAYLLNSYELSYGYNSAMIANGPFSGVCIGICVVGLLISLLLYSILKNKSNLICFILINSGLVFISFKHGFIRQDTGHVQTFFANALLVLCLMYITQKKQLALLSRCSSLILIFVLIAFIFKSSPRQIIPDIGGKYKTVKSAVLLATDNAAGKARFLENAKSKMRILKDETVKYIGGKSVDIMPWEISLPFAYDMNWTPRPVFQCYSAYTDKLDMLNSQFLESDKAPDFLLYANGGIDGRYPQFDTPAAFRTILRNYKPVFVDDNYHIYIVLRKADTQRSSAPKTLLVLNTEIGKPVSVPKIKNRYLFAKIYMDYNLLGKIAKLFYKPPRVNIILTVDGIPFEHNFIFSNARNGIFLSQYISDINDLPAIWNGDIRNNLDSITISTKYPAFYNKNIRVEFFEVPL